jgi:hypothetical protein
MHRWCRAGEVADRAVVLALVVLAGLVVRLVPVAAGPSTPVRPLTLGTRRHPKTPEPTSTHRQSTAAHPVASPDTRLSPSSAPVTIASATPKTNSASLLCGPRTAGSLTRCAAVQRWRRGATTPSAASAGCCSPSRTVSARAIRPEWYWGIRLRRLGVVSDASDVRLCPDLAAARRLGRLQVVD